MELTAIIPSYNGADKLPVLIRSLLEQTAIPEHIIIALDGSTDNSEEVIASFSSSIIEVITQENKGRGAIRNFGASRCKTKGMVFIDDDMELAPNAFESLRRSLTEVGTDCFIVGLCELKNEDSGELIEQWRLEVENNANNSHKDFQKIGHANYRFTSGLLYVHSELFKSLGGFDELLSDSEDFDLSMRALDKEHAIFFSKKFKAHHYDSRNIHQFIHRKVEYWNSKNDLAKRFPRYKELMPAQFVDPAKGRKNFLYRMFNYSSFWDFVLNSRFSSAVIPRSLRHMLLDRVIFASALIKYSK
jgi:glycosyltransferase involved in cell wall biosynthesis